MTGFLSSAKPKAWTVLALLCVLNPLPGAGQEIEIASTSVAISSRSGGRVELQLELADGSDQRVSFRDGLVRVNGVAVGPYEPGGALERSWRAFLAEHADREPRVMRQALLDWKPEDLGGAEAQTAAALERRIGELLGVAPSPAAVAADAETTTVTGPAGTQISIAPGKLSVEALTEQLSRLDEALAGLGEAAAGAEGRLALIVHDDYAIPAGREIAGNLALLGGELRLAGEVAGDVLVLDGTLVLEPSARIAGNVLQVGGSVREAGGRILGELLSLQSVAPEVAPAPPAPRARARSVPRSVVRTEHRGRGFFGGIAHNVSHAVGGLAGTLSTLLVLGLLGVLAVYFARPQLETVADTVRGEFGRAFLVGLAGEVLFFPVLLILVVLVITWLVIPFYLLAAVLACTGGYLAGAHAVGEIFAARRYRYAWLERLRRSNSYYYVLSGLVLLLLPFALENALWILGGPAAFLRHLALFVGVVATWVAGTTGFGAMILTRGGTRPLGESGSWNAGGETEAWSEPRSSAGTDAPEPETHG